MTATEAKTEEVEVTVQVDETADMKASAQRAVRAGATLVLDISVAKPANLAELFKMEEDGWPSILGFPSPAGPVAVELLIRSTLGVRELVKDAEAQQAQDYLSWYGRAKSIYDAVRAAQAERKVLVASGVASAEELAEAAAEVERQTAAGTALAAEWNESARAYYGRLFDTGVVAGWSTEDVGSPCDRESFVRLCERSAGTLARAVVTRFNQLVKPRLEVVEAEGEASAPEQPGSGSSGA